MISERRYPIGIQTFSEIIREGYLYVDKTDLVWQLAHYAKFIFMSRPRRFGKSLLTSTLESYFQGKKDLFEGLKIQEMEIEWEQYPVIRLDLSLAKGQETAADLKATLMWLLRPFTEQYGKIDLEVFSSDFDQPTENMKDALPLLYQSGYLTIKGYDRDSQLYTLAIPNQEVRIGYIDGLLPEVNGTSRR